MNKVNAIKAQRLSYDKEARALVEQMTLEEKVRLMGGDMDLQEMLEVLNQDENQHYNFVPFTSGGNERLGVPKMAFCDGPRGVVCDVGKSTCFPVSMCRGAAFDVDLEEAVGRAIGREVKAFGGNLFAGICINLPYHPGWGRSQETYGEDSFHLGQMGAALVRGVQKEHVIGCVKHFALNQMEISRFKVSVDCDKRTEREVFLPHFKEVIDAGAGAVMSSYNLYQGTHCGHHNYLLNTVLKNEWDFDGFVMSDFIWGVKDTVEAANGGQDMEMCATTYFGEKLVRAVRDGFVPEARINDAAVRIVRTLLWSRAGMNTSENPGRISDAGCKEHRELALLCAREGLTLLKNKDNVLPLAPDSAGLSVFGRLAVEKNTGDHGSSQVYPSYVVTPLEGIQRFCGSTKVSYCDGTDLDEAAQLAAENEMAVVVVGYDYRDEGEYVSENENEAYTGAIGGDRTDLRLHDEDVALIKRVAAAAKHTIVVLIGGNTILMDDWFDDVSGVIMAYYPGMEGGTALGEILFGYVNPSGKLPFVIPKDSGDLPRVRWDTTQQFYEYYHGYARLDKMGKEPFLPYGFGLSYTSFCLKDVSFRVEDGNLVAKGTLENTGKRRGTEVVQLYVGFNNSPVDRPVKSLMGFKRVQVDAGESETVCILCPVSKLRRYAPVEDEMVLDRMEYEVYLGTSSSPADLAEDKIWITSPLKPLDNPA